MWVQVTLFRVHQHHVSPEAYQLRSGLKLGDNLTFLLLYANGKSGVRVMPGVSQLGPHYFTGPPSQRRVSAPLCPAGREQRLLRLVMPR